MDDGECVCVYVFVRAMSPGVMMWSQKLLFGWEKEKKSCVNDVMKERLGRESR